MNRIVYGEGRQKLGAFKPDESVRKESVPTRDWVCGWRKGTDI